MPDSSADTPRPNLRRTGDDRLPGDPTREQFLERLCRVNQAGEYGAVRIYSGQLAVLGRTKAGPTLRHMLAQEEEHLRHFTEEVASRQVRPTVLQPLWHVMGFALGAGTALLGEKAAMACTVAVEEAIDEHYAEQRDKLGDDEADLRETVEKFRLEELEHRDIGLANKAEQAPGYGLLYQMVRNGSKLAIWLSTRV